MTARVSGASFPVRSVDEGVDVGGHLARVFPVRAAAGVGVEHEPGARDGVGHNGLLSGRKHREETGRPSFRRARGWARRCRQLGRVCVGEQAQHDIAPDAAGWLSRRPRPPRRLHRRGTPVVRQRLWYTTGLAGSGSRRGQGRPRDRGAAPTVGTRRVGSARWRLGQSWRAAGEQRAPAGTRRSRRWRGWLWPGGHRAFRTCLLAVSLICGAGVRTTSWYSRSLMSSIIVGRGSVSVGGGAAQVIDLRRRVSVPRTPTRHATCTYSCTRPPSRSRRSGRIAALDGGGVAPVGGC
jgi:hypothetical protein